LLSPDTGTDTARVHVTAAQKAERSVQLITGHYTSVIIFRLRNQMRNQTPLSVRPRLFEVLSKCETDLNSGAIVVVEEAQYSVRRFPDSVNS
jgi:hypothetical protein